ncbi:unnamed protein product [Caenorhabditis auriculariae]|uniref:Uridine 5'-monophosphate synthase n=1 Tax=Caenorhabditis auriculariae TaxID=2777116 RepID=A0A8S1H5U5_9PELO|nr:unnamed protein product [Caenorhabditis auriculariae]
MNALIGRTRPDALQRNLLRKMLASQVFKFGEFTLKSGQKSPIYIDLRECFGHSDLLILMSEGLSSMVTESRVEYSGIVGVPYGALPHASVVAGLYLQKPLLIVRKEAKAYGTKKLIEGLYQQGDRVILVEDVVTTGGSILEVVETLKNEGLVATDVFCILDREQGGRERLKEAGVNLYSLFNMETVMAFLASVNAINDQQWAEIVKALNLKYETVSRFEVSKEEEDLNVLPFTNAGRTSLQEREALTTSPLNHKIISFMKKKSSNLCLAIDYTTTEQILQMVEKAGPFVVAIKVHSDIITDFSESFTQQLVQLANNLEFIIFDDRKFADTGNTTKLQLTGPFKIAEWADVVTTHAVQGVDSIVPVFREFINNPAYRLSGVLLIAQLSTKGSLTNIHEYTKKAVQIADENRDIVSGFITQTRISEFSDILNWTPGVNLDAKNDSTGQQWRGVEQAIEIQQNDIVIVGRGVTSSKEPIQQLKRYRQTAWESLTKEENEKIDHN